MRTVKSTSFCLISYEHSCFNVCAWCWQSGHWWHPGKPVVPAVQSLAFSAPLSLVPAFLLPTWLHDYTLSKISDVRCCTSMIAYGLHRKLMRSAPYMAFWNGPGSGDTWKYIYGVHMKARCRYLWMELNNNLAMKKSWLPSLLTISQCILHLDRTCQNLRGSLE